MNKKYYHIRIGLKAVKGYLYRNDETDLTRVITEVVEPYNSDKPFFFGSRKIHPTHITEFTILETDATASQIFDDYYGQEDNTVVLGLTSNDAPFFCNDRRNTKNITQDIMSNIQSKKEVVKTDKVGVVVTGKQKTHIQKYIIKIDEATQDKESDLYLVWAELNALFGSKIPEIGDLFEEAKQHSGIVKRNLIAAKAVLENYIESENITKNARLFISYSTHDSDYINELVREIEKLGVEFFYDKKSIEWGDHWQNEIWKGINDADFAIIVFSKEFGKSEWTKKEQDAFIEKQKASKCKILPILYNVQISDVDSDFIRTIQAISSADYTVKDITIKLARILLKTAYGGIQNG